MSNEREKIILEELVKYKSVSVKELSQKLYASESSIRRDLTHLESQNFIKRTHGGAILEETATSRNKIPFYIRQLEQSDSKVIMAKKAVNYINDNDVIFLDASTSAFSLIPFLITKNKRLR